MKIIISIIAILISIPSVRAADTTVAIGPGTPGGVNLYVKSNQLDLPWQIAIGTMGSDLYGIEVGYQFARDNEGPFRSAQFLVGTSQFDDPSEEWNYIGVSATFLIQGNTFIEPGISFGSGDFDSPQVLLQFGWIID